jgi:hypothetical protein
MGRGDNYRRNLTYSGVGGGSGDRRFNYQARKISDFEVNST